MRELGRRVKGPGTIYLVGGATAVIFGLRDTTIDIDLKIELEPQGLFEAIRDLKEELSINIELAAPDEFLPPVAGWRERSLFICREGEVDFSHYDPVAQALSKLERGHEKDLSDVRALIGGGWVTTEALLDAHRSIQEGLIRYPAVDPEALRKKVDRFVASQSERDEE